MTGSDIKNFCVAAAQRPLRDFLDAEIDSAAALRAVAQKDFLEAISETSQSASEDSATLQELHTWNSQYGVHRKQHQQQLSYYL